MGGRTPRRSGLVSHGISVRGGLLRDYCISISEEGGRGDRDFQFIHPLQPLLC